MALILGTKAGEHDACFTLVRDGEPLFVHEVERFNRIRHGMSCAAHGLFEGLADAGLSIDDIDYVTNYVQPELVVKRRELYRSFFADGDPTAADRRYRQVAWELPLYRQLLIGLGIPAEKIVDVRHHIAHCAGAFYPSPYREAAILSVDGGGEADTMMLAHGRDEAIEVIYSEWHPHSLGDLCLAATRWLGWDEGEEDKTMALAARGEPEFYELLCAKFLEIGDEGFLHYRMPLSAEEALFALLGPGRRGDDISQHHMNLAASVQKITNEVMLRLAETLKLHTEAPNLLITGAVGLNSEANGAVMSAGLFDQVMAYPHANDVGAALGGAMWLEYNQLGRRRRGHWVMSHAFLGRDLDLDSVEAVAARFGLSWRKSDAAAVEAARHLAAGRIVGWVQGRAEIGRHALGNRSILGDPRRADIREEINTRVKHREAWRPCTPSVLAKDCGLYFDAVQPLPYMTIAAEAKPEWRETLAAMGYPDGTAPIQTVEPEQNPGFYALIEAFKAITGIGMVLNAPFNDRHEPLVQTVEQAIEDFLRMDMDVLIVGDYVFEQKPADAIVGPFHPARNNLRFLDPAASILVLAPHSLEGHKALFEAMGDHGKTCTLVPFDSDEMETLVRTGWMERYRAVTAIVPHESVDEALICRHDAVLFPTPWAGCDFLFDRAVMCADLLTIARTLAYTCRRPVYWADNRGGIVDMAPVFDVRDWLDDGHHPHVQGDESFRQAVGL